MKIRVTLKDPDTMPDAVEDAVKRLPKPDGISDDEWAHIREDRVREESAKITHAWMPYSEYLDVEFDTDAMTARVIPRAAGR